MLRPGIIAALVAAFTMSLAGSASAATSADLEVSMRGRPDPVAPGQYVSYALKVSNHGPDAADDVVVKATLPPTPSKVQFISASHECSAAGNVVTCDLGTVAAGVEPRLEVLIRVDFNTRFGIHSSAAITSSTPDPDTSNNTSNSNVTVLADSHDHLIQFDKSEVQVDFEGGQTRTVQVTCPAGGIMTDGSLRIDHVDQDTGTLLDVEIMRLRSISKNSYEVVAKNHAYGRAQAKLFGMCMAANTQSNQGHAHPLDSQLSDPPQIDTASAPAGYYTATVDCPYADQIAVSPGYDLRDGASGEQVLAEPTDTGWKFGFRLSSPGTVEVTARCLDRYVGLADGHVHELVVSHPDRVAPLPGNSVYEQQVSCSDEAKGIVGIYDLPDHLHMLGHDPRPKTRAYSIFNDASPTLSAYFGLLCIGDRTGTDPPPPAPPAAVSKTAKPAPGGGAVPVGVTCPVGGCSGTVTLYSAGAGTRAATAARRAIGTAAFHSYRYGATKVTVKIARAYRAAVRSGRIRTVTAEIKTAKGTVAKRATIRLTR
jgi:uncharacterized repeat protein (TIGR01451 family)